MPRAIYKATLSVGGERVAVKFYSAVQDRAVHFRLLHAEDLSPVRQRLVNGATGEEVPKEAVGKAFEVDRGVFVLLGDSEIASLTPEASREVEVPRFVPRGSIAPRWYERPYFLGPDGDEAGYMALVVALADSGREGVARWVMRKKRYAGVLRAHDGRLVLYTVRQPEEVVDVPAVEPPKARAPDEKELKLAEQLVSALEAPFDPAEFRDEYKDRLLGLVRAKAEGRRPHVRRRAPRPAAPSLATALRRSVEAAKEKRVA